MVVVGPGACVPSPIPDDPALRAPYTAAKIRMLRARIDDMLLRFSENNRDVIQMQKELDDLERCYLEEVEASHAPPDSAASHPMQPALCRDDGAYMGPDPVQPRSK